MSNQNGEGPAHQICIFVGRQQLDHVSLNDTIGAVDAGLLEEGEMCDLEPKDVDRTLTRTYSVSLTQHAWLKSFAFV